MGRRLPSGVLHARLSAEVTGDIVRRLQAGETHWSIGRVHGLNGVTVGTIARRAGFTYPKAQAAADARRGNPLRQPEASFQSQVVETAGLYRWLVYHTWLSKHSTAGFPDLVLVRPPRVIFAELKAEDGTVKPHQQTWLDALQACPGVEVYTWRPRNWAEITRVLR